MPHAGNALAAHPATSSAAARPRRARLAGWRTAFRPGSRSGTGFRQIRRSCHWPLPAPDGPDSSRVSSDVAAVGTGGNSSNAWRSASPERPRSWRSIASTKRHSAGSSVRLTKGETASPASLPPSTSKPPSAKPCVPMAERSPRPISLAQRATSGVVRPASRSSPAATDKANCVPVPSPACSAPRLRYRSDGGLLTHGRSGQRTAAQTPGPVRPAGRRPQSLGGANRERSPGASIITPAPPYCRSACPPNDSSRSAIGWAPKLARAGDMGLSIGSAAGAVRGGKAASGSAGE